DMAQHIKKEIEECDNSASNDEDYPENRSSEELHPLSFISAEYPKQETANDTNENQGSDDSKSHFKFEAIEIKEESNITSSSSSSGKDELD
ncbi:hypothetical protein L9F63_012439, partial [Diploptera punctata]